MPTANAPDTFCPSSRQHWRAWLLAHHATNQSVWLVYHKKSAGQPSLTWSEAVDEALCFGWIDSQARPLDATRYMQLFSRRKPRSTWSKINKDKVAQLQAAGLMQAAGLASIEVARRNGSWTILDEVEALLLPPDLAETLQRQPTAEHYFAALSRTNKRNLLQWLVLARRPETRQRRINTIVSQAARQQMPAPFGTR